MEREYLSRIAVLVAASTVLLTAAFVGVRSFLAGAAVGVSGRLPYYVFGGAVVFVVSMVYLEDPTRRGTQVFTSTASLSILGFTLIALGGEGVVYASRHPSELFGSQLVVYFLAAALVCTGSAYWSINHWRELAATTRS
ncbi:hypothetical protein [Halobacterium zhouii]|uniref:hypothetical protein n=1 Tax=Halobacterium zhouii TaxID=2902624 RepID=UPI001E55A628|nr:hypothetical protein [Halobacterium zhouii]